MYEKFIKIHEFKKTLYDDEKRKTLRSKINFQRY